MTARMKRVILKEVSDSREDMMKTDTLILRINPQLKERARASAEKEGKSLSEWVTDLIKIEIAKREGR